MGTILDGKSKEQLQQNIADLRQLFPEVCCEDKIDFDKLKQILGEYVDDNKIPMIVGEKLSYLKPQEQEWLLEGIVNSNIFPTKQQAEQLKECSANGKLNQGYIYAVLLKKENSKINVTIPAKKIGNYFPETYSKEQIEEVIFMLLDKWKENREGVADAEDTV